MNLAARLLAATIVLGPPARAYRAAAAPSSGGGPGVSTESVVGPAVQPGTLLPPLQQFCTSAAPAPTGASAPDVSAQESPAGMMPLPRNSFEGLSNSDNPRPFPVADTSGSAGVTAFGEVINSAIGFFDKATGTPVCPVQPLANLWADTGRECTLSVTDAVLRYDSLASRWVVMRPGLGGQCFAISQGDDPTAGWFRYLFPIGVPGVTAEVADYPKLSVWSNSYTYSARALATNQPPRALVGDYLVGFQREAMLEGSPAAAVEFLVPRSTATATTSTRFPDQFYFLPASAEGAAEGSGPPDDAPAPFVQRFAGTSSQLRTWNLLVDWQHPDGATFAHQDDLRVLAYDSNVHGIVQPPIDGVEAPRLSPGAPVIWQPLVWRRIDGHESLFGALSIAASSTSGSRAGVQWFELQRTGERWAVSQQGVYAPDDGNDRWNPSLNVDRIGNLGLLFNIAGPSLAPSLHYTGRIDSDQPGTLRPEQTLVDGGGSQATGPGCPPGGAPCAFGDYSQASLDPVDGCTLWMAGAYYPDQARGNVHNFATRIGSFRFPPCPAGAVLCPRTLRWGAALGVGPRQRYREGQKDQLGALGAGGQRHRVAEYLLVLCLATIDRFRYGPDIRFARDSGCTGTISASASGAGRLLHRGRCAANEELACIREEAEQLCEQHSGSD